MKKVKLGIIGESPGNGHPFSWSAIFNGYSPEEMEFCGYPVIPRYLEKEKWPEATLKVGSISSIWTQDIARSKFIAKCSNISNVCNTINDLTRDVQGVILARDDAENHLSFAKQILKKKLPILIDKPLALSIKDAKTIFSLSENLIFSCSSMRYDQDLDISKEFKLTNLKTIKAFTPKKWSTYAIHAIEPILCSYQKSFSHSGKNLFEILMNSNFTCFKKGKLTKVAVTLPREDNLNGVKIEIISTGNMSQNIEVICIDKYDQIIKKVFHQNTFNTFKKTLNIFEKSLVTFKEPLERDAMLASVLFLEKGLI